MFEDVTTVALHNALGALALRQRVIADNVANLQTPGFLAGRVQFEEALSDAVASGRPDAARAASPTVARSLEPTREDGNNVNLDHETLANVDTGLRYQLALRAMDGKLTGLRAVLRGA